MQYFFQLIFIEIIHVNCKFKQAVVPFCTNYEAKKLHTD